MKYVLIVSQLAVNNFHYGKKNFLVGTYNLIHMDMVCDVPEHSLNLDIEIHGLFLL